MSDGLLPDDSATPYLAKRCCFAQDAPPDDRDNARMNAILPPTTSLDPHPGLEQAFAAYARRWPEEAELAADFIALLSDPHDPYARDRLEGHFTASAWLVSADGRRTLLMHHAKLLRWLQPGGHADGDVDLPRVALKEANEETGLADLAVDDTAIFDLDRHWIPERKGVPGHWHYDVRYVVRATGGEAFTANEESLALAWRDVKDMAQAPDVSLSRMARKWLARRSGPEEA
jgi:8-oxo-dGTP pyrophosphatase MutT (NUDIX family)